VPDYGEGRPSANGRPNGRRRGVRVGIIGCGYWGPNLVRNLHEMAEVESLGVADVRQDRLAAIARRYPAVARFADHRRLLAGDVEAVVVASPIHTHHRLAREALLAGKHVLVEKPLATSVADAVELIDLARRRHLVLMAGHTFVYNPAVRELRRLVQAGELGRIYYGDAARLNLGLFQRHANVAWDLAPHDIAMLMYLLDEEPVLVSARGTSCVLSDVHDVCYLEIIFSGGTSANVHVSWLHPDKVRRLTLVGDRRMAVFDDVSTTAKLRIHDSGVERIPEKVSGDFTPAYRHGQIVIPSIDSREPLRLECEDFLRAVVSGSRPLSDDRQALAVVAALEAADRSLLSGGQRVPVEARALVAADRRHANGAGAASPNGVAAHGALTRDSDHGAA
jgi:predicted dehydrogenase